MPTDAEIARKLQLREFQKDPDGHLTWQLQQSSGSQGNDLASLQPDLSFQHPVPMETDSTDSETHDTDEIGYGQAAYVTDRISVNVDDDERVALQLEEQLKLTQEQEDAAFAQRLFEEEESEVRARRRHTLALPRGEPHRRNRPYRRLLGNLPTSQELNHQAQMQRNPFHPAFGSRDIDSAHDLEHDSPIQAFGHSHVQYPHRPRFSDPMRRSMFEMMQMFSGGMRPQDDVDLNDYEALCDLAERIGDVKNSGLSKECIDELPSHTFGKDNDGATSQKTDHECRICLSTFSEGEDVKTLPCLHMYHKSCIDNWLQRKGDCPICRERVKRES